MPRDDTRTLKRKVEAIITNINIYNRDIKKAVKRLKSNYDTTEIEDIDELISEFENNIKKMDRKKEKLLNKASRILKDVTSD